jgi:hypothetical protein
VQKRIAILLIISFIFNLIGCTYNKGYVKGYYIGTIHERFKNRSKEIDRLLEEFDRIFDENIY